MRGKLVQQIASALRKPATWAQPPTTRTETLRVNEAQTRAELDETDSLVKVGDPVVEVRGEEFGAPDE